MANQDASDIDMEWHETLGGPRDRRNLLSFRRGSGLHRCTPKPILPWVEHDDDDVRASVPSAFLENLLQVLLVDKRSDHAAHRFIEKCIKSDKLKTVMDLLIDEGSGEHEVLSGGGASKAYRYAPPILDNGV